MWTPTPSGNERIDAPDWFCEPPITLVIDQPFVTPSLQSNGPLVSTGVPSSFRVGIDAYGV